MSEYKDRPAAVTKGPFQLWPITADGVLIEVGMTLWDTNMCPFKIARVESEAGDHDVRLTVCDERDDIHRIRWWNCFSTRQAAEEGRKTG